MLCGLSGFFSGLARYTLYNQLHRLNALRQSKVLEVRSALRGMWGYRGAWKLAQQPVLPSVLFQHERPTQSDCVFTSNALSNSVLANLTQSLLLQRPPLSFPCLLVIFPHFPPLSQLLATFLIQYERLRGVQSSGVLFIFWFLSVLCAIVPFRSKILQASSQVRYMKHKPWMSLTFIIFFLSWFQSLIFLLLFTPLPLILPGTRVHQEFFTSQLFPPSPTLLFAEEWVLVDALFWHASQGRE